MWLVRFLPFRAVAAIGEAMGSVVFWLIPERRKVTRVNLAKCFPHWSEEKRESRKGLTTFVCRKFCCVVFLTLSPFQYSSGR